MDDYERPNRMQHHRHHEDPIYEVAEVIAFSILAGLNRIAEALESPGMKPEWIEELENKMGAVEDAVNRIEASLQGVSDEISQVVNVLNELAAREDPAQAVAELGSVADRLDSLKDQLENATTLDDAPPAETPPADQPADPATGEPTEPAPSDGQSNPPAEGTPSDTPSDLPPASGETAPADAGAGDAPSDGTDTGSSSTAGPLTGGSEVGGGGESGEITGPSGSNPVSAADVAAAEAVDPNQPQNDIV